MAKAASRFHADDLVGDGTGLRAEAPAAARHVQHKPIVLRKAVERTVDSRIAELERQLAERDSEKEGLSSELAEAKAELERLRAVPSADEGEELLLLEPDLVVDKLPKDRSGSDAFGSDDFEELVRSISADGQHDAIHVRRADDGGYEIAAGRRRLAACKRLGISVLARVRPLDRLAMLRLQYSENERRASISALERGMWFAEIKASDYKGSTARKIASDFGVTESMMSHYLYIARFPRDVLSRLRDVRKVSVHIARQVVDAVEADREEGLKKILSALDGAPEDIDPDAQISLMLGASVRSKQKTKGQKLRSEHFVLRGRRCATLARSGNTSLIRFSTEISHERVRELLARFVEEENAKPVEQSSSRE